MQAIPTTVDEFRRAYAGKELTWTRMTGSARFDYPIDYEVALLHVAEGGRRVDFLSRWAPDSYCHFHRHCGQTSLLVIEGEHHIVEQKAHETVHKIRSPGFAATNPPGDVHMEYGGPEGTLVFFSCEAVDGQLFDVELLSFKG